ncbi:MAG: hypothetical protein M0Q53_01180 [Prolixibacteraceae bacterium]|nr:hypothetical protein [Prolixibacteraceae bacterium]
MSEKFNDRYRISSARLQKWDYGWNASYFITICTSGRDNYFGKISAGMIDLTEIGKMAQKYWLEIPCHFPFIKLDGFVVMPNHIHGIITIAKSNIKVNLSDLDIWEETSSTKGDSHQSVLSPGQKRFRNQGKGTVSSIIGSYKSIVSRNAHRLNSEFGWQAKFYDNIVRSVVEYNTISNYIKTNPKRWNEDKFFK